MPQFDLAAEASAFAQEIQNLVDATLPGERQIRAAQAGERYAVRPEGPGMAAKSFPVLVGGRPRAWLRLSFHCVPDRAGRYLAIARSEFFLIAEGDSEPLARLEFRRDSYSAPSAHWQVHAERPTFSALLADANVKAPAGLASLHLPVGGAQMRPCLEDFLQFLVRECGADHRPGWRQAVEAGRERWRRRQIAALVRDAPDVAVRVLRETGCSVDVPSSGLPGRPESLRAW